MSSNRSNSYLVLVLIVAVFKTLAVGQAMSKYDRAASEQMLDAVSSDVRKYYYDPFLHGVDWNARIADAKRAIENAPSYDVAITDIADAIDKLGDSHTHLFPPRGKSRVSYGWEYQMVGERCYVTHVRPGSDAEAKGVHPGDQVLSIDGYVPQRSTIAKVEYLLNMLRPQLQLWVDIVTPSGEKRHLGPAAKVLPFPLVSGPQEWGIEVRQLQDISHLAKPRFAAVGQDALVVKLPTFSINPDGIQGIINKAREHKELILDLRGNSGGSPETVKEVLGGLFDHETKIADRVTRSGKNTVSAKPLHHVFDGKLIVLVDSSSASASEVLARVVQLEKRGTIMGDRTAGMVMEGEFHVHRLSETALFFATMVTRADLIMSDDRSLEHVGVTPDEVILPTAGDLAQGRDPVLAHAAETLGAKLSPEDAGKLFPYEWAPE